MTSVMLATYPETFAGGAIIAGLPYGCAASVKEAFEAMFNERLTSARALGDRVRAASRYQGSLAQALRLAWECGPDRKTVECRGDHWSVAQCARALGSSLARGESHRPPAPCLA